MNNPNFKPPIRRSLVGLALFNCCRGIRADALRSILVYACVHLETLILGGLQLEGAPTQPPNTAAAPTFRIPSLRTLAVASPVFHPADASTDLVNNCRDGCCCVFRDFAADNLEFLEIAGFVNEALTHLGSLITQRVYRPNTSPLTLRINVGDRLDVAGSDELERRLLSIPPNIHLHIYDHNFCSQDEIGKASSLRIPLQLDCSPANLAELEATPIRVRNLRNLAIGSPLFTRRGSKSLCVPGCACVIGVLVADSLEYLQVACGLANALHYLITVIDRRANLGGDESSWALTVMLNNTDLLRCSCTQGGRAIATSFQHPPPCGILGCLIILGII